MARPRVFVSSTFYDLRHIREDLRRFFNNELGYEAVLSEHGNIPYGSEGPPEQYAYREIDLCDLLVAIIGGRIGTASRQGDGSITQKEIMRALDRKVPVYIFIDRSVHSEYRTYLQNRGVSEIRYHYVDDPAIFAFIERISALPSGNPIFEYGSTQEIITLLREQIGGLVHRLLHEHRQARLFDAVEGMNNAAKTLNELVEYLVAEKERGTDAIQSILMSNHPAFNRFKTVMRLKHPVFFGNYTEMQGYLDAYQYRQVPSDDEKDQPVRWSRVQRNEIRTISIWTSYMFEPDGSLKVMTPAEWDDDWISSQEKALPQFNTVTEEDIPF